MECQVPSIHARAELDNILGREESVYFIKDSRYKIYSPEYNNVIEVPAEFIPCKCTEDDYEKENNLYDWIYANYSDNSSSSPEEEIWKATDMVKESMRPLDDKFNDYTTEVLCPCHIPANIIRYFNANSIGSCRIESKRKSNSKMEALEKELATHWENTKEERERTHTGKMYEKYMKEKG